MSWQYAATDGNYGDAQGMRFLPLHSQLHDDAPVDLEDDTDVAAWASTHGTDAVFVLVCIDDKDTTITLHADETEAMAAIRLNYVSTDDGEVPDEELLDFCARQGLLVHLRCCRIPQLA
jgi:hypothetical protein